MSIHCILSVRLKYKVLYVCLSVCLSVVMSSQVTRLKMKEVANVLATCLSNESMS